MNLLSTYIMRDGDQIREIGSSPRTTDTGAIDALNRVDVRIDGAFCLVSIEHRPAKVFWWSDAEDDERQVGYVESAENPGMWENICVQLYMSDTVYNIGPQNGRYQITTHRLEHRYVSARHLAAGEPLVNLTTEGLLMRIKIKNGRCTETPVERGVEFDDWLVNAWPLIISQRDGVVRISNGLLIVADIEASLTHASAVTNHHYALVNQDAVRVLQLNYWYDEIIDDSVYELESPVVQLIHNTILCDDGTVWKLDADSGLELVDHVSEVIYPPRHRKQPAY